MNSSRPSPQHFSHRPGQTDCDHCESKESNPLCSVSNRLDEIGQHRSSSHYKTGQSIFYQGNEPLGLFTVERGLVKLEMINEAGQAHTLRLMGPGCILGYRALFSKEPYRASAIAVEDSKLCFLPKNFIFDLFKSEPQVALNLAERLAKDLREAESKWIKQVDQEAPERVAEALVFLSEKFVDQNWTRKDIGQWAGTTPETVIRTLSRFEKEGLIEQDKRQIKILNRPELIKKYSQT